MGVLEDKESFSLPHELSVTGLYHRHLLES